MAVIEKSGTVPAGVVHVPVDPRDPEIGVLQGIRVLWRYHLRPPQLRRAIDLLPDLEWIHSDYVGVEDLPLDVIAERGIALSNGAGISADPMAEWVVLSLLLAAKQLPRFVRQSDSATWDMGAVLAELRGAVVLLLGLGDVGTRAAALLEPFGADVRACTRRVRHRRPRGVAKLVNGVEWRAEIPEADYVVCTLPHTSETAGMLDATVFTAMKPGAWLVNVSRGAVVDEAALLDALDSGRLGGAVLDAFSEEPLPSGHPLWGRPNVLVLPHVTWSSPHTLDDFTWRFAAQLRRFAGGLPPADLVDLTAGY
jgi:phosphoglycerate dehydrogenase-like enzyme